MRQLASQPSALRSSSRGADPDIVEDYRGSVYPSLDKALALARDKAYIWNYKHPFQNPPTSELRLPHPSRSYESLPFGTLVRFAAEGETGLLVISPSSGKITYWENVDNVGALSLFEKQSNRLESSFGSLFSGETVIDLEDAGQSGFVVVFSSGRAAQLLLRDAQSRPAINIAFLRKPEANGGGGFFGSIKSVFSGGGWLRDVAAVRARPSQGRGLTDLLVGTENAVFQSWRLGWTGHPSFKHEVDAHTVLQQALSQCFPNLDEALPQSSDFKIRDFALSKEISPQTGKSAEDRTLSFEVFALVANESPMDPLSALVSIQLSGEKATVSRTIPLRAPLFYPPMSISKMRAKVYVSEPTSNVFIVYGKAISLVSIHPPQIQARSPRSKPSKNALPTFQETVHLVENDQIYTIGSGFEVEEQPFVLVFVRQHGLLQFQCTRPPMQDSFDQCTISSKDKLEQAISYGFQPPNPLDLSITKYHKFSTDEMAQAADEISKDILSSDFPHMNTANPSMDQNFESRLSLLENLARYITNAYPHTSRLTRWHLRWDAEKMAAARAMWSVFEDQLKVNPPGQHPFFSAAITGLHNDYKHIRRPPGDYDPIRWFMRKDISKMDIVLIFCYTTIKSLVETKPALSESSIIRSFISQSGELLIAGLATAFSFRQDNAAMYALQNESMEDGVLINGYEGLPEFWTSRMPLAERLEHWLQKAYGVASQCMNDDNLEKEIALGAKVAGDMTRIIPLWSKVFRERYLWKAGLPDKAQQDDSPSIKAFYEKQRSQLIAKLGDIDQSVSGMALAEEYRDMDALYDLVSGEAALYMGFSQELQQKKPANDQERDQMQNEWMQVNKRMEALEKRVRRYTKMFGLPYSERWYGGYMHAKGFPEILDQGSKGYQAEVTQFLRNKPSRRKLCWINDVIGEKDYAHAGTVLNQTAATENDVWAKRIELSLSKISLLAADEAEREKEKDNERQQPKRRTSLFSLSSSQLPNPTTPPNFSPSIEQLQESANKLMDIQNRIYEHLSPTLYGATDAIAQLEVVMADFGKQRRESPMRSTAKSLLEHGLETLISRQVMEAEELVDVLTLMDVRRCEMPERCIANQHGYLALQALMATRYTEEHGAIPVEGNAGIINGPERWDAVLKTTWRRIFIADNWPSINNTRNKSDKQVLKSVEKTELFQTIYSILKADSKSPRPPMLKPAEVIGAGTRTADHLSRFPSSDIAEPIALDCAKEDQALKWMIDDLRMDHWWETSRNLAKERIDAEVAEGKKEQMELRWWIDGGLESIDRSRGESDGTEESIEEVNGEAVQSESE